MPTVSALKQQLLDVDARIAAEKAAAVAKVRVLMDELGVTDRDLAIALRGRKAPTSSAPVKYRDEHGNTWTGIGQRPRWLKTRLLAGATLEQFQVRRK